MTNDLVTVYDSVNVGAIPSDAQYLLGYVDGFANIPAMRARFPHAQIITCTVAGNPAMVADVESGAMTPYDARSWIAERRYTGPFPVIYSNESSFVAVTVELYGPAWSWWAADWTGVPHLVPASDATQYADPTTSGGDYDVSVAKLSLIEALFPPPPPPKKGSKMIIVNNGTTQYILFDDGSVIPIDTPADLAALAEVLPGSVTLSPAMVARFTQR